MSGDDGRARLFLVHSRTPERSTPRPAPADDAALLARLRAGDTRAAAAFHDRVRPQVDRTLRRLLGARDHDRDDLAQLALIELVTTIDRYRGDCSLDSWAAMLTSRVVYKAFRRRKLERRLFADSSPEELELVGHVPQGRLSARRLLEGVREHLEAMNPDRAWAFVLHDVCGHDLRELAQILGISVAAAQSRLVRGRAELHQRVEGDRELARALEQEGP